MMPATFAFNAESGARHDCDFNLGGVLRVRLTDAAAADVTAVARTFGPPQRATGTPADITVQYSDQLPAAPSTLMGRNAFGAGSDGLFVYGRRTGQPKARLPLEDIGNQPLIHCRRGIGDVPYLLDIVNLTMLQHHYIPLHASAFRYRDRGVLVAGWTKGGKTETLLAFAEQGADYVGDEWVVLGAGGRCMFGLPLPVTLWSWQLPYLDRLRPSITRGQRLRLAAVDRATAFHRRLHRTPLRRTSPFRLLDKVLPSLESQAKVRIAPRQLFPGQFAAGPTAVDDIVLAVAHEKSSTEVAIITGDHFAARMQHSNWVEQLPFFTAYRAWLYAYPERNNSFLDEAPGRQATLLAGALAGRPALFLGHPFPVPLNNLYEVLAPHLDDRRTP